MGGVNQPTRMGSVGGCPYDGGVGHGVFHETSSDHVAVVADFNQGVDQQVSFDIFTWGGAVQCHLDFRCRDGRRWQRPEAAAT